MNKGGKPKANLSDRLPIFEQAILNGKGIYESLAIAEIPDQTYYNYCARTPGYREKIATMKRRVLEAAEGVIIEELTRKPDTEAERKERLQLAERHYKSESIALPVIQTAPTTTVQVNVGNQLTAENVNDLNDDEVALVTNRQKTLAQVLADRKNPAKPSAS